MSKPVINTTSTAFNHDFL